MTVNPIHSQHAPSANPLFDQVVADIRPKPGRTLSPITTLSRYLDRAAASPAAPATAPATAPAKAPTASLRRAAASSAPAAAPVVDVDRITRKPLATDDLTPEEREIVAEMGGTVARLILSMLKDDARR